MSISTTESLLFAASNSCRFTCTELATNINIVLLNTVVTGSLNFDQSCSFNSVNCIIGSLLDTAVNSSLTAAASGTNFNTNEVYTLNVSSLGPNLTNTDGETVSKTLKSSLYQLMSNTCSLSLSQVQQDNYYYLRDSTTGTITLGQNAEASNVNCALQAAAKYMEYNSQQSDPSFSIPWKYITVGVIILLIVTVIVLWIILRPHHSMTRFATRLASPIV